MSITVRVDVKTTNPSNNSQGFSRNAVFAEARRRKRQREMADNLCRAGLGWENIRKPRVWLIFGGVVVTLTRVAPSDGLDSDDNLRSALKSVKDGVADYLGINDRDPRVTWKYDQRRGRPKEYAVLVTFEERA